MAFVYLITEDTDKPKYKIGMTKKKKIDNRLKELQTGNSSQLSIKDYFETDAPFKLELMMHNHFMNKNAINEWYDLNKDDVKNFKETCQHYQSIIDALKDNSFFKRT
jgi:hypothetical protein